MPLPEITHPDLSMPSRRILRALCPDPMAFSSLSEPSKLRACDGGDGPKDRRQGGALRADSRVAVHGLLYGNAHCYRCSRPRWRKPHTHQTNPPASARFCRPDTFSYRGDSLGVRTARTECGLNMRPRSVTRLLTGHVPTPLGCEPASTNFGA